VGRVARAPARRRRAGDDSRSAALRAAFGGCALHSAAALDFAA